MGRPFTLTSSYVHFLAVVRYLFSMPYRQLEGFARALGNIVGIPSGGYTGLRRRILELDVPPYADLIGSNEPMTIALDYTGVKVHKSGGWMEHVHSKKKRYIKVHFAVNVETKEVVTMDVTTDAAHDSQVAERLFNGAEAKGKVTKVLDDGAYDTTWLYDVLHHKGIDAVIKPKKNSILNTRSEARRYEVNLYRNLGHEGWAEVKGYGRRRSVETA